MFIVIVFNRLQTMKRFSIHWVFYDVPRLLKDAWTGLNKSSCHVHTVLKRGFTVRVSLLRKFKIAPEAISVRYHIRSVGNCQKTKKSSS